MEIMFNRSLGCLLISFLYIICKCSATRVLPCQSESNGNGNKTIDDVVFVSGCDSYPCKLKKNSTVRVEINFNPDSDIRALITSVYAWVLYIPLPYLGVDGSNACENFYRASNQQKVPCPLQRGQKYRYKNAIFIPKSYPKVKMTIHWSFKEPNTNQDVLCFELPARIVN